MDKLVYLPSLSCSFFWVHLPVYYFSAIQFGNFSNDIMQDFYGDRPITYKVMEIFIVDD